MRMTVTANAVAFDAFRDYNQSVPRATITRSAPGRILSGGAMTLNARDALLNDQAQIVAGGALNITGQAVDNRGRSISVNTQRTGTAFAWSNYNEGCGGWDGCDYNYDAYRDSAYVQDVPKTFVLDVNRSQGMTAPSSQDLASGTQLTAAVVAGGAAALPASANSLTVPNNSLFRVTPNPLGNFIVETDPRFANYRNWLGSDYMLNALGLDPATTQKRLGDGFYEQRLVNEQVAQLTGQRFLANYTSEEVQYKALMDAGVTFARTFAQQFQLRPGIALTAAQVAQLTSDIVWLVEQDVTVPDGRGGTVQVKALVPVVYVVPRTDDLSGKGVLLAGREVNINLSGDLSNSGTIAGRTVVSLTAENVHNISGRITGDTVAVAARTDINVTGGQIDAASSLTAIAGRDINVVTTTSSATNRTGGLGSGGATEVNAASNNTFSMTGIDRVAGLYVTGNTAGLQAPWFASAGRDLNLIAGVIGNNNANGSTTLVAVNNINLATVTTANSSDQRRGDDDFVRDAQTKEIGSQIQTAGSLSLNAGNDLNARAANVQAGGDLTASAGNSVNLTAGRATNSFGFGMTTAESDLFSSSSTKERRTSDQDNAVGSSIGGKTVTSSAAKTSTSKAAPSSATQVPPWPPAATSASRPRRTPAAARLSLRRRSQACSTAKAFGITVGTREQSTDQKSRGTTAAASTVGSIGGNVTLVANEVVQTGRQRRHGPRRRHHHRRQEGRHRRGPREQPQRDRAEVQADRSDAGSHIARHQRHANHRQDERRGQRHQRQPHARPGFGQCRLCRQERL
jgi:filamentous hemagglutinin